MTKNTLLNTAIVICKSLRIIHVLFFILITAIFIHHQISPSTYKNFNWNNTSITKDLNLNFKYETKYKFNYNNKQYSDAEVFNLSKMTTFSLSIFYIKIVTSMILGFLCLKEFQNIIESVKKIKTFQERNVSSFRKIGKYLLAIFILSTYNSFTFQNGKISTFNISTFLPCLIVLAFIMAEIFKEGNQLSEEINLTV